jgi:hypothetical protein
MKSSILFCLSFVLFLISTFGADMTSGVFCADYDVEAHLISQNGTITTNQVVAGKTYAVGNTLVDLQPSTNTTFYLSGGILIDVAPKSTLTLNLFDQEVKNIDSIPRKAEFGSHNISLSIGNGEYSIIYPNIDQYSSISISTPFTSYQLFGGKYFFRVSDKSVIAYVLEGTMQVIEDKKSDKTERGKIAVAIPFSDFDSGVSDKIISSIKTVKPEETTRFSSPILMAEKKANDIQFFIINRNVVGISLR